MRRKPKRGDMLQLRLASMYANPCDKEPSKFCSGSYYLWGDEQKDGRYPIADTLRMRSFLLQKQKKKMGHFDAFTRMLPKSTILLRALWNVEFATRFVLLWIITRTSLLTLASVIVTGTESTHFQIAYMPWFTCFRKQKLTT